MAACSTPLSTGRGAVSRSEETTAVAAPERDTSPAAVTWRALCLRRLERRRLPQNSCSTDTSRKVCGVTQVTVRMYSERFMKDFLVFKMVDIDLLLVFASCVGKFGGLYNVVLCNVLYRYSSEPRI